MTSSSFAPQAGDGEQGTGVPRRALLRGGAVGLGALLPVAGAVDSATAATAADTSGTSATAGAGSAGAVAEGSGAAAETRVVAREGANLAVALSPDGRTLALDALNAIWLLPAAGGAARRLTADDQDATQPHWAPDGRSLVFQSFREGTYDLWRIGADGTGLRRLTEGPAYDQEPKFSPDGRLVAFSSDRGHAGRIWVLETGSGRTRALTRGDRDLAMPTWSPDGRRVAYVADGTAIESVDVGSGATKTLLTGAAGAVLYAPAFAPDGQRLAYVQVTGPRAALMLDGRELTDDEDVFPLAPVWLSAGELLYTADGRIRRRTLRGERTDVPFSATVSVPRADRHPRRAPDLTSRGPQRLLGLADPALSPDGRTVVVRALNALWLLTEGARPRKAVADGYWNASPDWSPDGRSFVYVSDRAGTANLWRHDVARGTDERLTDLPDAQLSPRWSPDGTRIAYQDESGATWVLTVADGSVTKVVDELYQPGPPAWSPDGRLIALAAVAPYSRRAEGNGHNQILTVDLDTHEVRYQAVAPERSLSTRSGDGPLWTPDGRHLVVGVESQVWRVPVDAGGRITGGPELLTEDTADSLSIGARSATLLYLSEGRLRAVGLDGKGARTLPTRLTWSHRPAPAGRTVVRAGAVWDGGGDRLRHEVDVVVENGRITEVARRGAVRGGKVVDASGLTVMPGLIDTHNHWHWRGPQWGDRQGRAWLAYGVTTSRTPGDPAYQMVENREALAAGARVGPRYFGSGDGFEGTRGRHRVMRPVFSRAQLDRDLRRALALRYDLLKSYIRLPLDLQQELVERGHAAGVPVTSHYLYPAARVGLDGMEHTGGGNRLGYSRTLSFAAGRTFQDSVDLLAATGMWISTTTLFATELLAGDRSLVEDERTRVLFPDWEYARLRQKADSAASGPDAELNHAWTVGDCDMLLRVHRAGGLVVAGTDAALDDIAISLHQNLRALTKYGFAPWEALTTATGNAARCLGLGDTLGAVAPGYLADLAFVAGDPLRDVSAAAAVRQVMVDGRLHTVPELLEPFRRPAAAGARPARPNRVRAAAPSALRDTAAYWHGAEWRHRGCCR
ncbi:amidohydrolase family protein [Streptomyces sp. NPDC047017]|uniref:amidohydrolase family protein n=1 Tax=Streptomyces sp. NPDC047017 TaxID=3155024 RepID=UPI0033FEA7D9